MLTVGMYMADRYEILDKIGTGGMSDVYKAMDHLLGRNVAVKVLKSEYSEDVNFLSKFRTEAQAAAGLEHPNIVNIYDVGSDNKMHYIVMEYVEGITLKTYIEKKEKLSYKEAISIAIQTANGIRVAHNKQIVHRDIKPQNIMISTEGKVKVTDFGIARAASSNTINSEAMGSVHYASPEQARNGFIDTKSDIYSLGIVMYEMVTGRVPFHGDTVVSVALQHLQEEIVLPSVFTPDIPISFEKIILKCVQKSPDRRYTTIDDLIVDLKRALISPDEDFVVMDMITAQTEVNIANQEEIDPEDVTAPKSYDVNEEDLLNGAYSDDDDDEDGLLNPKMDKVVTVVGIVIFVIMAVLVFLLIGLFADWGGFGKNPQNNPNQQEQEKEDTKIKVIDVTGMTFEQAKDALQKLGLGIYIIDTETSDEIAEGLIISQDIKEGTKVDENTTINVVVSLGKEVAENVIPNIISMNQDAATALLQGMPDSLVVSVKYEYSDTIALGQVMDVYPEIGTKVKAGSKITLTISRGIEKVSIPNLVGKSETQAIAELTELGFDEDKIIIKRAESETYEEGYVISQDPADGKNVTKDTEITITVSSGKATKYYSYSETIVLPEELQAKLDDGTYTELLEVEIQLILDGSTKPIQTWTTDGLPKQITVDSIENVSKGRIKIVYVFAVPSLDPDTGEQLLDEEGNPIYEEKIEQTEYAVTFEEVITEDATGKKDEESEESDKETEEDSEE